MLDAELPERLVLEHDDGLVVFRLRLLPHDDHDFVLAAAELLVAALAPALLDAQTYHAVRDAQPRYEKGGVVARKASPS